MLLKQIRNVKFQQQLTNNYVVKTSELGDTLKFCCCMYSTELGYTELPRKLHRTERKPWVTDVNVLKRRARLFKKQKQNPNEIALRAPENGMLVDHLVPVAHRVMAARTQLVSCIARLVRSVPVHTCSVCGEVHVGDPPHKIRTCNVAGSLPNKEHSWVRGGVEHVLPDVESFHLYDRVGRAVSHKEQLLVDRIPAIVELCVQAGVDILEYPTRRRAFPVYNIAGKTIDFEKRFPKGDDASGEDIDTYGFWNKRKKFVGEKHEILQSDDLKGVAVMGMKAWELMRSGALKLMQKYSVQTCGYCPEVQVGPKGHRVRNCQAYKHQMRDGQHGWQEATVDDILPPVYVWHVRYPQKGELLVDNLKKFYGMLPAVVELCAQAGAQVGRRYSGVMRDDIVVPELHEEKLVV